MSLLEQMLAASKREPQKLRVPELGLDVWLRQLTGEEALALSYQYRGLPKEESAEVAGQRAASSLRAYLCHEDGTPVLATHEEARKLVASLPARAMTWIIDAGQKLNALQEEAPEALEKK